MQCDGEKAESPLQLQHPSQETFMERIALIAGATGITGQNLAHHLTKSEGWKVYGLSRRPADLESVENIAADLKEPGELKKILNGKRISHAFFTSWQKMNSEEENCEVNGAMLRNLLEALDEHPIENVSLVTGGKNYFGSFEDSGKHPVITPYREEQPRKPGLNFYYTQEDILFEHATKKGFSWNVHRPNMIVGYAIGNLMNIGSTLAVYATICRETGRPFVFPGSPTIYRGVSDSSDARLVARQIEWAATTKAASNQAFNTVNGDVYRWNWMWERIATYFGIPVGEYPGAINSLEESMQDIEPIWQEIISKHNLVPTRLADLASWWHTDSDLSREFETFADMSKSRTLGFLEYQRSDESFFHVFDRLRENRFIP